MQPQVCGRYVSESNTVGHPHFLTNAYLGDSLAKIAEVRERYDPDRLFFEPHEGLS